ncbi:MAG: cadherin-like beta sandwich domain-containing protein, partial [Lachnospiraceae bacterium]|nr:cadherin-like beta sandwich domain-containing protein [Lachnospiraceae bacterium]
MEKRFPTILYGMAAVFLCLLVLTASLITGGVSAASSMSEACTTQDEIHEAFPEAYWEGLDALLKAHPAWQFVAFYEGVTFEECMDEEAEMKLSRNLAAGLSESGPGGYYYPTSWYSTELTGAYNWAGNAYYGFDNGNMFQASEEAVRYCMDPRNWLTEEQIFQFLDSTVPFAPEVSGEIVQYIFETIGVDMWVAPAEETGLFTEGPDGETVFYTYSELVDLLAANLEWEDRFGNDRFGVNQATMATRIRQEHGSGKSKLIAGDYPFTLPDGTVIPGGYYNYFAMDASGSSLEQIYNNGLNEAYNYGWDTRYKSIAGGMKRYTERYFADCQYCPYMLKFNVRSDSPRQYWGQYMQDIFAPQKEARNLYRAISSVEGAMDSPMTFIIPVYDSLPEEVSPEPDPNRIGNPNYKLGSIFVDGNMVDGFHMDTLEYALTVPNDKASVRLNASAYAGTTTIKVGSATGTGTLATDLSLVYGRNVFDFVCTAQNGLSRTYRLVITREPRAELKS